MNLDYMQRFPNQVAEKRYNFCVGETIADIIGNYTKTLMDPDFSYAAGLAIQGVPPTDGGEAIQAAVSGAVAYGALPETADLRDPVDTSALMEANFANYTDIQKAEAEKFVMNGFNWYLTYDQIAAHLMNYKTGVAVGLKWYDSFNYPYPDGTLRTPGPLEPFTYHAVAVYEKTSAGLRAKPWMGQNFGDHGYVYIPKSVFEMCQTGSAGFNPYAKRWMTLTYTALAYFSNFRNIYPLFVKALQ